MTEPKFNSKTPNLKPSVLCSFVAERNLPKLPSCELFLVTAVFFPGKKRMKSAVSLSIMFDLTSGY